MKHREVIALIDVNGNNFMCNEVCLEDQTPSSGPIAKQALFYRPTQHTMTSLLHSCYNYKFWLYRTFLIFLL